MSVMAYIEEARKAWAALATAEENLLKTVQPIVEDIIDQFLTVGLKSITYEDVPVAIRSFNDDNTIMLCIGLMPNFAVHLLGRHGGEEECCHPVKPGRHLEGGIPEAKWLVENYPNLANDIVRKGNTVKALTDVLKGSFPKLFGGDVKTVDDLLKKAAEGAASIIGKVS